MDLECAHVCQLLKRLGSITPFTKEHRAKDGGVTSMTFNDLSWEQFPLIDPYALQPALRNHPLLYPPMYIFLYANYKYWDLTVENDLKAIVAPIMSNFILMAIQWMYRHSFNWFSTLIMSNSQQKNQKY